MIPNVHVKKYMLLSMQQRLEVLKDIYVAGMTPQQVGKKYGVGTRTIQRIIRNTEQIIALVKNQRVLKRRKITKIHYEDIDRELVSWLAEKRVLRYRVTDALIIEKATELKQNFPSCSGFKASRGWLTKFKRRHDIRLLNMYQEETADDDSIDADAAFLANFRKTMEKENVGPENVYNMEVSGLVWKALPTRTAAGKKGNNLVDAKPRRSRITIGLCANAFGTHKLMPVVIYRYNNPRALRHLASIPAILKTQENLEMDRTVFLDWFENHFKTAVRQRQQENRTAGKVILLVNNCEAYRVSTEEHDDFMIMYLPNNATSTLQQTPLQCIMERTKRVFRRKLVKRILKYDRAIKDFYVNYRIKHCIDILAESWSEITKEEITKAANKMINPDGSCVRCETRELEPDWQGMMSRIAGEQGTSARVLPFLRYCEQTERKSDKVRVEVETTEHRAGAQQIINDGSMDETTKNELRVIFERLTFYSMQTPASMQYMVQGIKMFFLGTDS
nr:jerky protein homolog-like [Megalopta genalis]